MTLFYTGTQQAITAANNKISLNAELPFRNTTSWSDVAASYSDPTFFFIMMPPAEGWKREDGTYFTQAQMIAGVNNVVAMPYDPAWSPPSPLPPVGNE